MIYKSPKKGHKSFAEYANNIFKTIILPYIRSGYNDVRVLFDDSGSQGLSPKCIEQERRDKKDNSDDDSFDEITDETSLPSNWQNFLKIRKNKHLLCNYLFYKFQKIVQPYLPDHVKFVVSGGFHYALNDRNWTSACITKTDIVQKTFKCADEDFSQNHEESDTQIWLHVTDTTCKTVHIRSIDRDIGLIGMSHFSKFLSKEIFIEYQQNPIKFIDLNVLHNSLSTDSDLVSLRKEIVGKIIQTVYICSGCDFVSYFVGHGKSSFYKALFQYCRFITCQTDIRYGCLSNTDHDTYRSGLLAFYRLIGCVYFQSNRVTLNEYDSPEQILKNCASDDVLQKHYEFLNIIRKGTWKGEYEDTLLPSNAALELHWLRSCWVSRVWGSATTPTFDFPSLNSYGWDVEDGKVRIRWDNEENIKDIQANVSYLTRGCKCPKTKCSSNRCKCKKSGQFCGPGCTCKNCENTMLENDIENTIENETIEADSQNDNNEIQEYAEPVSNESEENDFDAFDLEFDGSDVEEIGDVYASDSECEIEIEPLDHGESDSDEDGLF